MDQVRKINKQNIEDILSLTPMQEGLLFHYLNEPGGRHYFEQLELEIEGPVERGAFGGAWASVVENNPALRTLFRWEAINEPVQMILKRHEPDIRYHDLAAPDAVEGLEEIKAAGRREGFDLRDVPFRVSLCKLPGGKHHVIISNHHILYDGWSNAVILKEFLEAYNLLHEGGRPERKKKTGLKAFIRHLDGLDVPARRTYWEDYLAGFEGRCEFPYKKTLTAAAGEESPGVSSARTLRAAVQGAPALEAFMRERKLTWGTVFNCAWGLLLQKYTAREDVIFGTTVSGRGPGVEGIEEMVGLFINTIPLRVRAGGGETVAQVLARVREDLQEREAYASAPLAEIKKWGGAGAGEELFDSLAVLVNYPMDQSLARAGGTFTIRGYSMEESTGYDILVAVTPGETPELELTYKTGLFEAGDVNRVCGHFSQLLQRLPGAADLGVSELEIITPAEKEEILTRFNRPAGAYIGARPFPLLFEDRAGRTPHRTALAVHHDHGSQCLTYGALNRAANQWARRLREMGAGPDRTVGILLERGAHMLTAILAVWKAGGAYIPLDTGYPARRIMQVLEDSETAVLVTEETYLRDRPDLEQGLRDGGAAVFFPGAAGTGALSGENPGYPADMHGLAYVIYTSGSTGKPKGAMVEHIGMLNHLWAKKEDLDLDDTCRIAQNASHTFDISVWQFMVALLCGGQTFVYTNHWVMEPAPFMRRVAADGITVLEVVPSYLSVLLDVLENPGETVPPLRYLMVTGEEVKPHLVERWFRRCPGIPMVNAYGPTEASDDITHHLMTAPPRAGRVPIGRVLRNLTIYIVDPGMNWCPVGITGEIWVSGVGVGRGYLNDRARTAEVFMDDPFAGSPGVRLYKTGDLGCRLPDGSIAFFGRKDYQVKIRGFRIELGEIENALTGHPAVKEAVVVDREEDGGDKYLCGYVVPDGEVSLTGLRAYLRERLPYYMVPTHLVLLAEVPLTPNGKVDRKALPEPGPAAAAEAQDLIPLVTEGMLEQAAQGPGSKRPAAGPLEDASASAFEPAAPPAPGERERLLVEFNRTAAPYPAQKTFHELFEEQAARTPEGIAVACRGKQVTYRQLNGAAEALARVLLRMGAGPRGLIALMTEREAWMVTAVLGILKTGSAYVPIDPEYPPDRVRFMLADSAVPLLVTDLGGEAESMAPGCRTVHPAHLPADPPGPDPEATRRPAGPDDPVYVSYTSGTTGKPKGVMVEHRAVVNFSYAMIRELDFRAEDVILSLSTLAWDMIGTELFPPLITGMKMVVGTREEQLFSEATAAVMRAEGVDIFQVTPANLRAFMALPGGPAVLAGLRLLLVGADEFPAPLLEQVRQMTPARIYNMYGPTETTTWSTCKDTGGGVLNIGKPIANTQVYILGRDGAVMPAGTPGQLYIGGDGVARGYLNRPELTAERFGPAAIPGSPRLYHTGDLAAWLPGGDIRFLGRNDFQVQVRGVRVEPGEIENCLARLPEIQQAVVTPWDSPSGEKELRAFIVAREHLAGARVREYLAAELPLSFMPAFIYRLEEIPLTANGKVNRKLLSTARLQGMHTVEHGVPEGEVEETLAARWREVLGVESVGTGDNFFEIGGDSIKAIQLSSRLKKNGLKLEVRDLFLNPTIKQLAKRVRPAEPAKQRDTALKSAPLTPVQQWFFQSALRDPHHFNQAVMIYREQGFDPALVETVFAHLLEHHDALRLVFRLEGDGAVTQEIPAPGAVPPPKPEVVEVDDIAAQTGKTPDTVIRGTANRLQGQLDPFTGRHLRLGLFKTRKGDHLLVVIHHLAVDGVSWRILLEDFAAAYRRVMDKIEIAPPEKSDGFLYWARQLHAYAAGKPALREWEFWQQVETAPVPPLPVDRAVDPAQKTFGQLEHLETELDETATRPLLTGAHHAYGTEMNDLLLSALVSAFHRWAGVTRLRVQLEGHGREPVVEGIDLGRTVGWFTTQFPVLLELTRPGDLAYTVKSVKETLRRIPRKGIGYGVLKYLSPPAAGMEFGPPPQVGFNYLGQFDPGAGTGEENLFTASPMPIGDAVGPNSQRPLTLDINAVVQGGRFTFTLSYNREEYRRETMERLATAYRDFLVDITDHCTKKDKKELTPSDVGDKDLSIEALQDIQDMLDL